MDSSRIFKGYQYKVFLDFREEYDTNGTYEKLYQLAARKRRSLNLDAIREQTLIPLHKVFDELFSEKIFEEVNSFCFEDEKSAKKSSIPDGTMVKVEHLINEINNIESIPLSNEEVARELKSDLSSVKYFTKCWEADITRNQSQKIT